MANPSKEFSEDWQKVGSGISLISIAQVREICSSAILKAIPSVHK